MTRSGRSVLVTDKGKSLWIIQPISATVRDEIKRRQEVKEILA
jgi:hypothetical protein